MNRYKSFEDALLERQTELKEFLKLNVLYPELKNVLKNRPDNLPIGLYNSKVNINDGEIVQRFHKIPTWKFVSLSSKSSNMLFHQAA